MAKEEKEQKVKKEVKEQSNKKVKEEKSKEKIDNKIILKIFNITFWVIIFALFAIWITDFVLTKADRNPVFCINKKELKYESGTVNQCTGLGYKVYNYNTDKYVGREFTYIFAKPQTEK